MTKPETVIAEELGRRVAAAMDGKGDFHEKSLCVHEAVQAYETFASACRMRHQSESWWVRVFGR